MAPHPLFFNRLRPFTATVDEAERVEKAIHLSVGYLVPLGSKFDMHIFAGPSKFRYEQEVVDSVTIVESGSTFTATPNVVTAGGQHLGRALRRRRVVSHLPVIRDVGAAGGLPALREGVVGHPGREQQGRAPIPAACSTAAAFASGSEPARRRRHRAGRQVGPSLYGMRQPPSDGRAERGGG